MLLPLGLDTRQIDKLWLGEMSKLGSRRGALAHKSKVGMKSVSDPFTDLADVEKLAYYAAGRSIKNKSKIDCLEALDDIIEIKLNNLRISTLPSTQQVAVATTKTWWQRLMSGFGH